MGVGNQNLVLKYIKGFQIPLPPLREQYHIVAKVHKLMALCDDLEARQQEQKLGCIRLGTAALTALENATSVDLTRFWSMVYQPFDSLFNCQENVTSLRKAILHLAVRGRLVPQSLGDEPPSALVEGIRAERAKLVMDGVTLKTKSYPQISKDEYPYHLPKNWIWLRLADIAHDWGQKEPVQNFTYIDVASIDKERGRIGDAVKVLKPEQAPSRARKLVAKGSVIYSTVRPYLLNIAIVDQEFKPDPIVSTAFAVLHPYSGISNKYLYYYLRSKPFIDYVEAEMAGMAYPAINETRLFKGLVPVPPLDEQQRIVAKVDKLVALCDKLEATIRQSQIASASVADSMTRAAIVNAR
jgi:type I restriction enzyme S subunit